MATFSETFVSSGNSLTKDDALRVLQQIRDAHPESSGWVETDGYVEQLSDGKWRAVRVHEKCR